jgi:hypothetical protein
MTHRDTAQALREKLASQLEAQKGIEAAIATTRHQLRELERPAHERRFRSIVLGIVGQLAMMCSVAGFLLYTSVPRVGCRARLRLAWTRNASRMQRSCT